MAYQVLVMWWDTIRVFETLNDVVDYLNYQFVCNNMDNVRVLDLYDHQRVPYDLLWNIYYHNSAKRRKRWDQKRWGDYEYRNGPVKGTGKGRWSYGPYMRHPRTQQELREIALFESYEELKDLNIRIRGRRKDLPTHWDDFARRDRQDRSWKRHRKNQYKNQE